MRSLKALVPWTIALAVFAAGGYYLIQLGSSKPVARRIVPPAPVIASPARLGTVPVSLSVVGSVTPVATVAIKSRIDGQVMAAHFKEGQMVRKGDLLFSIDPRPLQAQLRQAEATLARDEALLVRARADLSRTADLANKNIVAKQKLDEVRANVDALKAMIKAAIANIDYIKLQIGYTEIRSPIDGQTGSFLISPGNLVKANDTAALVVINQVAPIHVSFFVPERHYDEVRRRLARQGALGPLMAEIRLAQDTRVRTRGPLSFINNAMDAPTGTFQLKATVPNADGGLAPGQFVRVSLTLQNLSNVVVVPAEAVQIGPRGRYVFVVKADRTAELRRVTVGPTANDLTVIQAGLKPGEMVVKEGQLRLFPGARVSPRPAGRPGSGGPGTEGPARRSPRPATGH